MGKFASEEALAKKRGELAAMNLKVHNVENPALQIGLSLGAFHDAEAQANLELARLGARGIRTARVVLERAAEQITLLRLPAVSEAMQPEVEKHAFAGVAVSGTVPVKRTEKQVPIGI